MKETAIRKFSCEICGKETDFELVYYGKMGGNVGQQNTMTCMKCGHWLPLRKDIEGIFN